MGKRNKGQRLTGGDVSLVLNNMLPGYGYQTVAEQSYVSSATAMEIATAYPLWDYYRKPEKFNYGDTNS